MPSRIVISNARQKLLALDRDARKELIEVINETGENLVNRNRGVVQAWNHKPKFTYVVTLARDYLEVIVVPTGRFARIWKFVDQGTKGPYFIPKFPLPYPLRFRLGYIARTQPIAKANAGSGVRVGRFVSKIQVVHPGIEGRHFSREYDEEEKALFRRNVENAFRRLIRKFNR